MAALLSSPASLHARDLGGGRTEPFSASHAGQRPADVAVVAWRLRWWQPHGSVPPVVASSGDFLPISLHSHGIPRGPPGCQISSSKLHPGRQTSTAFSRPLQPSGVVFVIWIGSTVSDFSGSWGRGKCPFLTSQSSPEVKPFLPFPPPLHSETLS